MGIKCVLFIVSLSKHIVNTAAAMARAREIAFAKKESELKIRQAQLEASLETLRLEKTVAAIQAKAEALETAAELECREKSSVIELPIEDRTERTQVYISEQTNSVVDPQMAVLDGPFYDSGGISTSGVQQTQATEPHLQKEGQCTLYVTPPKSQPFNVESVQYPAISQSADVRFTFPNQNEACSPLPPDIYQLPSAAFQGSEERRRDRRVMLDYSQTQSVTPSQAGPYQGNSHANNQMSDVVKFIARRELVSTGLMQFNDHPEIFRAWRASFINATKDLNLSPSEEVDLLIKWLGREPAEHARRIRAVHINHPLQGLCLIWDRLYETYDSPEMVESSLFKRLESFPKISNRDSHRLRELGDLLMEIQAAKQDGYLMGLSYLDTSSGVNPIIQKLPFSLQEKWLTVGSKYKEDYRVSFPPFKFLVDFVSRQAKIRDDPSFSLTTVQEEFRKPNKPIFPRAVATYKTQVSAENPSAANELKNKAKQCFLHNKPHPLSRSNQIKSNHFYCHITTAQVPW